MQRLVPVFFVLALTSILAATVQAQECTWCLSSVALQTRDGQPWVDGKPVTLVVNVASRVSGELPKEAQAVVMQTDGDRTKCLGVPLKLVSSDAGGSVYAGVFFPFRAARYDGQLVVGGDVQPITFDVHRVAAGAAPAGDLPMAEPLDTSAQVPVVFTVERLTLFGALGILAALAVFGMRSQRRLLA
jgi:hypothetical protein